MQPKPNTSQKIAARMAQPDPNDPAVVLTLGDMDDLGRLFKRRIVTKEELLLAAYDAATVTVEGVAIALEPKLLSRLKSRCLDKGNFPRWLTDVVIRQLHDYAGW